MKPGLACGVVLLAGLILAGCASSPPPRSSASSGGARCLSRPDTSGTQPLIYLFCVQTN
jgi:hypothetical protein